MAGDQTVVVDRDAAALLTPVLQRVQAVVAGGGDVHAVLRVDSKDAALLVELSLLIILHMNPQYMVSRNENGGELKQLSPTDHWQSVASVNA